MNESKEQAKMPPLVQGGYLAFDPGGTNAEITAKNEKKGNTGYFYYVNYRNYEFGTISGENSVEHGKSIDILIKKLKPSNVAWETSQNIKVRFINKHLLELLYLNGIIPYILTINNISPAHMYKIINLEVDRKLNSGEIYGLSMKQVQGEKGRPKNTFFFHNQAITIHECDALAVFYILWTGRLKRPWPWK